MFPYQCICPFSLQQFSSTHSYRIYKECFSLDNLLSKSQYRLIITSGYHIQAGGRQFSRFSHFFCTWFAVVSLLISSPGLASLWVISMARGQ